MCIGNKFSEIEQKVFMSMLLQNFEIDTVCPGNPKHPVVLCPQGAKVIFKRIQKNC